MNKYFCFCFFSAVYKIRRKSIDFLKFDCMTMISLSTSITNSDEDNRWASQPFTVKHLGMVIVYKQAAPGFATTKRISVRFSGKI